MKKRANNGFSVVDSKSNLAEAFRTLRTNIQFSSIDSKLRSIVVTSSKPDEGKSTVIQNLAISMALTNVKVLLIDADLRKPTIYKYFNIGNNSGLTNILMNQAEEEKIVHMIPEVPDLHVMTSGPIPPNPSELLSSQRMAHFLERITEKYDLVLVDSPPVGVVTDAAILSTMVDGTLLVCRQEETNINELVQAKENLEKVNANILGVVLNSVKRTGKKYDYQYYHYGEDAEN